MTHELSDSIFKKDEFSNINNEKSDNFSYEDPLPDYQKKISYNDITSYNGIKLSNKNDNCFLTNTKDIINNNDNNNQLDKNTQNFSNRIKIESKEKPRRSRKTKSMDFASNPNLFNNSKSIIIKQKKIVIPKLIAQKYNTDESYGYLLPDININNLAKTQKSSNNNDSPNQSKDKRKLSAKLDNSLINQNNNNNGNISRNNETLQLRDSYTLKEIVNKNAYDQLLIKLQKNEEQKNRLKRVDENNFRSDYNESTKLEKFVRLMDSGIKSNEIALIKYINEKEEISDIFLKKVKESSEDKRIKANKICQIIFNVKMKEKLMNKIKLEKIQEKKEEESSLYKVYLEKMRNNLKDSSETLNNYNNYFSLKNPENIKVNRELKCIQRHNEYNKEWNRFNIEKYMRRNRRGDSSSMNSTLKPEVNISIIGWI